VINTETQHPPDPTIPHISASLTRYCHCLPRVLYRPINSCRCKPTAPTHRRVFINDLCARTGIYSHGSRRRHSASEKASPVMSEYGWVSKSSALHIAVFLSSFVTRTIVTIVFPHRHLQRRITRVNYYVYIISDQNVIPR